MWQRIFDSESQPWQNVLNGDGCAAFDGQHQSFSLEAHELSGMPFFVPENWAGTYDYPLICYLHDDGRSEQDLWNWFPAISDQNYLALGVRAPFPAHSLLPGEYRWRGQRPDATAAVLQDAVELVQRGWSVHPDRIILMGEGNGAVAALQQFMLSQLCSDPEDLQFSGVICRDLPGWWARALPPVPEFANGRVLLIDPQCDDRGETLAALDGLSESGIAVTYSGENQLMLPETTPLPVVPHLTHASLINHWIMAGISTAIC